MNAFHDLNCVLKHKQDTFFLSNIQNIESNCHIIFDKVFPIIFFWWKVYSSQLYLFIHFLFFFVDHFLFLHYLTQLLHRIENICCLFFVDGIYCCFFCFLSNQENLHMIYHDSDVFYDIIMNIIEDKLTTFCWFKVAVMFIFSESKNYFITSSASSFIMIFMLSIFECITRSSSLSMEEVISYCWLNFHVSYFFRLFLMSFKYSLILLRYSSTDSCHCYFCIQYHCYSKN